MKIVPAALALLLALGCYNEQPDGPRVRPPTGPEPPGSSAPPSFVATRIPDLLPGQTYRGLEGGLYGGGSNLPPAAHDSAGRASGSSIQPAGGKIVVLCLGFSSVQRECERFQAEEIGVVPVRDELNLPPGTWAVEVRSGIVVVNGAQSAADIEQWTRDPAYDIVRDQRLPPYGEDDVQVIWMQLHSTTAATTPALPAANAHAWLIRDGCAVVLTKLRERYPNLRQVFFSAKQFTGYSTVPDNAEPFSYEGGFGLRECILNDAGPSFVGWGPYLWDSSWPRELFANDGYHPSALGSAQIAALLRGFLNQSPYTPWWNRPAGAGHRVIDP